MDRISNLSDDLLLKIVSSLATKNVVATMLLSKRWRFLWTMLPKLDFDCGSRIKPSGYGRFFKFVDRSMVLNRAPVLESLKFGVGPCCSSEDLVTWIRIGMVLQVRELEIFDRVDTYEDSSIMLLPKALYTYEKLEVLKLTYLSVLDVPTDVFFPSLKSLHLVCVMYGPQTGIEESYRRLLSGCPVLEELVLDKSENSYRLPSLYVEMSTLQRLSILDRSPPGWDKTLGCTMVFNAPSLKYLNFVDYYGDLCLSGNMPEVVEANVSVNLENPEKLLESLTSVKRLCLCFTASMLHHDQIHRIGFYHLLHLELCGYSERWWDLLTWMLESSPKLQLLKLCSCEEHPWGDSIKGNWRGPSSVPECLMFHLHTFMWKHGRINNEEKKIVAYILKNARQLKTVDISAWRPYSKEVKSQKLSELVSLPRASSSCQLILN